MPHQNALPLSVREAIASQCIGVAEEVVNDFLERMDPEYFSSFEPEAIARHITLAAALSLDHPCELSCLPARDHRFELTVVAYDYFSEFAAICGLLSAFGLNIEEGRIYTFTEAGPSPSVKADLGRRIRPRGRPGLGRKKIVDIFYVRPVESASFTAQTRQRLSDELTRVVKLLDDGRYEDARKQVNRQLVEQLSKRRSAFSRLLHTIRITFDNDRSPNDTVMDIESDDTPAFLYAFANALAMRNIYISKATFENEGGKVRDRFYVRNRFGQKLIEQADQQQLRLAAVLIKQFTHALTWAPDPAKALDSFDQFLDLIVEESRHSSSSSSLEFLKEKASLPILARLLGASDFLWEDFLRRQHGNLLPMLQDYQHTPLIRPRAALEKDLDRLVDRAKNDEARKEVLNAFKDRELFRIDMVHLLDTTTTVPDFSLALTELAELIMARSLKDCTAKLTRHYGSPRLENNRPCPFTILGMGKFGGRELGYASDIEVLFVYGGSGQTNGKQRVANSEYFERLAQELLGWIEAKQEGIFHLDVRLRPHGGKGSLANAFDEIQRYYGHAGLAAPFERQALIKLRTVAGDQRLGRLVERHRDTFVYSAEPWDCAAALDLRRQQIKELVEPGQINVKYSAGGLIDIEYAVQYLQIMHGHQRPALRQVNTLRAIEALAKEKLITLQDADRLTHSYLFVRKLIDGLRMVRGHAKDLVLPDPHSEDSVFLARRLGYTTDDWRAGAEHLQADIDQHMSETRRFFEERFGRL